MRSWPACVALVFLPAWAQSPASAPGAVGAQTPAACADCGVVRSVRPVEKQSKPATDAGKPSGLVATVPLGGGKVQVGSSTKLGNDVVLTERTWDVVVRLDDGRFRVVSVGEAPGVAEGDRVRVEGTRLVKLQSAASPATPPALPTPRK